MNDSTMFIHAGVNLMDRGLGVPTPPKHVTFYVVIVFRPLSSCYRTSLVKQCLLVETILR